MLLGVSLVVFVMVRAIPGDPAQILLGQQATEERVAEMRAEMGLDQPLPLQYVLYLGKALRGDLGVSIVTGRPVTTELLLTISKGINGAGDDTREAHKSHLDESQIIDGLLLVTHQDRPAFRKPAQRSLYPTHLLAG